MFNIGDSCNRAYREREPGGNEIVSQRCHPVLQLNLKKAELINKVAMLFLLNIS